MILIFLPVLRKLDLDEELNLKQQEREQTLLDKGLLTQEEFDVRQTNIEKIRADIEVLEVELDKTNITAPFLRYCRIQKCKHWKSCK
ncbi:MAG: hypothetical protein R2942_07335 [Ignavibacteria bacterium]